MELDFSHQAHFIVALAPEIILSVWGIVILLVGVSRRRPVGPRTSADLGWLSLLGLLLAASANFWLYSVTEVGTDSMIALDRFALFSNWIILSGAGFAVLISQSYIQRQGLQAAEFYALLIFSTMGLMVMAAARDLIVIFLGLEIMSIALYVMAAINRRDPRSAEAGLKYFLLGAFSTGFFLYGIALVYGATGSTNISAIADSITSGSAHGAILLFGIALLAVGFSFKVSAVPFHMWTPDVYEGAPTPVTAFMSVAVKAGAFLAFLRVFSVAFASAYESWWAILWGLSVLTMVVANFIATVQVSIKRMLAYSGIAHAGYLMVAIVAANETAAAGLLFYLLTYTLMNIGAFGIVILVSGQGEDRLKIEDYAGFGWRQPLLGVLLTIFLLSLAGFPGTAGFMGKVFLLQGAVEADLVYLSVILVLTTVVSYWYYLRVAWFMWMSDAPAGVAADPIEAPFAMRIALIVSVVLILYLGVFPGATLELARSSVGALSAVGPGLIGLGF
jgi:NADH-quinone oxidoreductase subunit N